MAFKRTSRQVPGMLCNGFALRQPQKPEPQLILLLCQRWCWSGGGQEIDRIDDGHGHNAFLGAKIEAEHPTDNLVG